MTQRHEHDSEIQTISKNTGTKAKAGRARRNMTSTQTTWSWTVQLRDRDADVFSLRQAPIHDIEYKSEPIDVSQQYLEDIINCGKIRTYLTYYEYNQIHVEFFSGGTCCGNKTAEQ